MESRGTKLETWDLVIIALYFVIILGIGIWATYKSNRGTVSGYFLAGRYMTWIPIGASLFASNIGSEHFIGLAGSGAAGGLSVGAWTFNALFLFPILGWIFLPIYIASGICTLPELIHRRLGGHRIRMWLTFIYLLLYIFTKISVNLFSSALFIRLALGWNLYLAIIVVLCITAICMITGGLSAVMYTDTLCTFMMIVGSFIVMGLGFQEVGGYAALKAKFMTAVANDTLYSNSTCGRPGKDSFVMLRGPLDSYMPWPGFFLGDTLTKTMWYWCADQMIVQRLFAAKSFSHAQGGVIFTAYIKIIPFFVLVLPGMISRVLSPDRIACSVPEKCMEICGSPVSCTNIAYPELVLKILPTGLRGLMMAVMVAALMSDLTSIFNSCSTLFTIDLYARIRKKASVRELMIVGRLFVIFMTIVGVLWIPIVQNVRGEMFVYIQAVASYFSPPLTCLFLVVIFWKRCTEKGAFWGLVVGFVVGAIRMVLDFAYKKPDCGKPDERPSIIKDVHYMYFCIMLFFSTLIPMVIISLLTEPHPDANLARLTWWTRHDPPSDKDVAEVQRDDDNLIAMKSLTQPEDVQNMNGSEKAEEEEVNVQFQNNKRTKKDLLLSWFCGFEEETPEKMKIAEANNSRVQELTSLKQDRWAKIFLNVNAVLLYVIGIYLFIYFTVNA